MPSKSPYTIKIAKSHKEVEAIRNIWENLQSHPNADIDFYLNIVNSREEIIRPHVIVLYANEQPKAMIIGRIEEKDFDLKVGYKTLYKSKVSALSVVYGGILGDISNDIADALTSELIASLKQGEADIVFLSNIRVDSNIYRMAKKKPIFLCREYLIIQNLHWRMSLPVSIDGFFQKMKSKHRYWIRRTKRLLEKKFPKQVTIKTFRDSDQIEQLCKDMERVANKTYQRGLGVGFIDNDENRRRFELSANRRWLRAHLMYIEENPAAFWVGTLYKKKFYADLTGYDPNYRKFELGTLLLIKVIEDLCNDNIKEMDFGFGDALYKARFADNNWKEANVYIFAKTPKAIMLNTLRTLTTIMTLFAKKIIEWLKLREKLKKRWRKKVTLKRTT